MKFDIENILYILVIIVWAVVGFIRKNKSKDKRPSTAMPPVGEPQQSDISTILEEILGKNRPHEKQVVVQQEKPQSQKKQAQPYLGKTVLAGDNTERSITKTINPTHNLFAHEKNKLKKKTIITPVSLAEEAAPESAINIRDIFNSPGDLRKAVVFSEILNPPYLEKRSS